MKTPDNAPRHRADVTQACTCLGVVPWRNIVQCVGALSIALALTGCSPQPVGDELARPAISSPVPMAVALADAQNWATRQPGRFYSVPSPSSSMAPRITSKCVVLLETYRGTPLFKGDLVRFDRGDVNGVLHEIYEVTPTHVFMTGSNNKVSDGWFPISSISLQVAGILYTAR